MLKPRPFTALAAFWTLLAGVLAGWCASQAPSTRTAQGTINAPLPTSPDEPGPAVPLLVSGEPVSWSAARFHLAEAAGGVVVEELALAYALDNACDRAGISVGAADLRRERSLLVDALSAAPGSRGADSRRLLERLRAERGLGPRRFDALLRRNAQLRALVQDRVIVTDAEIELAHAVRFGERHRVRLVLVEREQHAASLRRELASASNPAARTIAFAAAAVEHSIAPSAAAGGSLGPVSLQDPALPAVLRSTLRPLAPGEVSPVVAVSGGFALAMVDALPGVPGVVSAERAPTLAQARADLERNLRARKERLAMDQLAAELLGRESISVLDPAMAWSFEARSVR